MKKRLLITSIVMMLVVAVALSTATYAWFTQNASVTASTVTMTAGTADGQSISIGWLGSELKTTSIAAVNGAALQPMAPTTNLTGTNAGAYDATNNATGAQFTGALVDLSKNFVSAGVVRNPYTWTAPSEDFNSVTAFYINNDSNSQAVSINVAINSITNNTEKGPTALANGTLLEGSNKVYYRYDSTAGTYTQLVAGTDYTANVSKVGDAAGETNNNTALENGTIFATKGVQDYVRVAIFATTDQSAALDEVNGTDYTFKGLLAKANSATTVYGAIAQGNAAADLQTMTSDSDNSVQVIGTLQPLHRVYVIVKVWLDGASFTEHESNQAADVSLTFSAGTAA